VASGAEAETSDPELRCVQGVLQTRGWLPLGARVAVGCRKLRLATLLDLVCEDSQGRVVLLKLTSGFEDCYDAVGQGCFAAPMDTVEMSHRQIHFLHLVMSRWLFQHSAHPFSHRPLHPQAYVLRVGARAVERTGKPQCSAELTPIPECWQTVPVQALLDPLYANRNQSSQVRNWVLLNGRAKSLYRFARSQARIRSGAKKIDNSQ